MRNDQSTFIKELGYMIDEFDELQDLRWSDLEYLTEYRELTMKKNDGLPIDQARLDQLEPRFKNKIVTSARWNKFQNALVGMQTFIKEEIEDFVKQKQIDIDTAVKDGIDMISKGKDDALISIEKKKENILDYMDSTTAGAIRNDIGDMTDSMVEGRSLVDKTNNLKDQADGMDEDLATTKEDFSSHLADEATHGIGNKGTLKTTHKTSVVGAVNELFTNVSNGKALVGNAITGVDDSVVIPTDPSFEDLASVIAGISTGKKWVSGSIRVTSSNKNSLNITNLPFTPSLLFFYSTSSNGKHISSLGVAKKNSAMKGFNNGFSNCLTGGHDGDAPYARGINIGFGNNYIDNLSVSLENFGTPYVDITWYAFE